MSRGGNSLELAPRGPRPHFNHAGVLLFGLAPEKHLQQAKISYGRYCGKDKASVVDRATFLGPSREIPEERLLLLPSLPRQFREAANQFNAPFTTRVYAERLSITLRTAQKDLQVLIDIGLVCRDGKVG